MSLQKFKDGLAKELYGKTVVEANLNGNCIQCNENAMANCYSDDGRKEFYILGLCEKCFDEICTNF